MRLGGLAWRNLARRRVRSLLTAASITAAVGAFLCLAGLSGGVARAWNGGMVARGSHVVAMRKGSVEILSTTIPAAVAAETAQWPGVLDAAGELVNVAILESGDTALVSGWPVGSFLWSAQPLVAGRLPGSEEILIGSELAQDEGLEVGGLLRLEGRDLRVSGLLGATGALMSSAVVMPLPLMQALWNRPGAVTFLHLRLRRPAARAEVERVVSELQEHFPQLRFAESGRVAEDDRVLDLFAAINRATSAVGLGMAFVVILNTLLMAIVERTAELALLSAVGWPQGRVVALVVAEGVLLSLVGGAGGVLVGLAGLWWIGAASALRGFVDPWLSLIQLGQAAAAALLLGLAGSVYPALRAVWIDPVEALRAA